MFGFSFWMEAPFLFWALTFFVFGATTGSFLNVCIHRMPLEQSLVSPPSQCPQCGIRIPWRLNLPLISWLWLGGKCQECKQSISVRYFLVELLTGLGFLACWLAHGNIDSYGNIDPWIALIYCLFLGGVIAATFIDFEHFIIPDSITLGGIMAGFLLAFAWPGLLGTETRTDAIEASGLGILVGGGIVLAVLQLGKLLFGRVRIQLPESSEIVFSETALHLPDEEIPYEELFFRKSDRAVFYGRRIELVERCIREAPVWLSQEALKIGEEKLDPQLVPYLEARTDEITLPREAMGLGDVKFMAAIGAFLGWKGAVFSLMASSVLGALVGVALIAVGRREWSGRLPYGPYIAVAAVVWMFFDNAILEAWMPGPPSAGQDGLPTFQ